MLETNIEALIEQGLSAASSPVFSANRIWARHSNEKADVARTLARVIRTLSKHAPLSRPLRALSIGCGNEPQFRLLQATFEGGIWLYDLDQGALDAVSERVGRQMIEGVETVQGDYAADFSDREAAEAVLRAKLGGRPFDLITLHHSLYYSPPSQWRPIVETLYRTMLAPTGAIHIALMSPAAHGEGSNNWLYNHFAEKYFGHVNDQDLGALKAQLGDDSHFTDAQILSKTSEVRFFVDDFAAYMAPVWMVLLYPSVHPFTVDQRRQITRYVLETLWLRNRPLTEVIDHLVIYRGLPSQGLI
ncbi:MAG: class I SAM-dependent methyltransferase [Pseudomonadota bacterium]